MRNKILIPLLFVAVRGSVSAAQITFSAGNPAVAADVNANFTELYNAKWTLTGSDLSYSAGNVGIGVANPGVKLGVVGGSAITNSTTGFAILGATGGTHLSFDSTQIQGWSNATAANLAINPLGGNVGIGFTSPTMKLVVSGNTTSSIAVHSALDNTAYRGIGYHFMHESTDNAYILAQRPSGVADGADLIFQNRPTGGALTSRMVIQSTGEVGIGTTSPAEILDVGGNIKSSGTVMINAAAGNARKIEIYTNNLRRWNLGADGVAENTGTQVGSDFEIRRFQDSGGAFGNTIVLKITRSNGLLQLPLYNTGTLTSDASGNITVSSDGRMKDIVGKTETGLSEVLQMYGKRWRWKPGMGMETQGVYEGFIAQDVERLVPLAVGGKADGMKSLAYHALLPTFANAIRELKSEKDTQVLALEKRAAEAEQKYAALLKQMLHEKAQAEARAAKLELRLARLEASLEKSRVVARR